ncbi:efflux RND transporter periplasmic adaptor subunit [uncultured Algimonas sp.]|uniref:efflux RND transporter periplasmic adaptor subunit n=1 Tax=uncultured Algimonas sp. TaxID=1547920 RepID=UPI0026309781|nr:efflux RND transporter periplasmic adaptor subunit [uncultured Algimonas sp.]
MTPPARTLGSADPAPALHTDGGRQRYPIFRTVIFSLLGLAVIGGGTFAVIKANDKPEEQRRPFTPLAVMADYAKRQDVRLTVTTQGEARPQTEIDLVPQVGGKVVYVSPNFVEGGIFRRGETLVRIDPSDYNVAVVRAEAGVAQAQQVLDREIAEGEIARRDYEDLGRGEPSALALRLPQRRQAEAALQAAQADLDNAKLQLTRTSVTAPFAGRVRSKSSDLGQFVSPGARLGQIFSIDIVEVRLPFTDADLAKVDLPIAYVAKDRDSAPKVRLSTTIGGVRQVWNGEIMRTDAAYDTQTRALFAIVEVADPYGSGASDNGVPLAPGLFLDAEIEGRIFEDALVIPRDGLRVDDEIYVVDDKGQAEIRTVSVIDANPQRAVLSAGVEAGELVVLSPMERSRVSIPLKVLDVNDPKTVLVEPEPPAWMKNRDGDDTETSDDTDGETSDTAGESGGSSE